MQNRRQLCTQRSRPPHAHRHKFGRCERHGRPRICKNCLRHPQKRVLPRTASLRLIVQTFPKGSVRRIGRPLFFVCPLPVCSFSLFHSCSSPIGNVITIVSPLSDLALIVPLWASIMFLHIASPSPLPSTFVLLDSSIR